MADHTEIFEGNESAAEFPRFWDWVRGIVSRRHLSSKKLLLAFEEGVPVTHPKTKRDWFATLDAIEPSNSEVAALVRLSPTWRLNHEVPRGIAHVPAKTWTFTFGEGEFSPAKTETNSPDLLLVYCFPRFMSLKESLNLFREFAGNELTRLRSDGAET